MVDHGFKWIAHLVFNNHSLTDTLYIGLFFSYFTPVSERQKHHIDVVEEEIHHHPEKYPGIKPLEHPSPTEAEKEVKEFDKRYSLPKEPEPHIKPTL